MSMFFVQLRWQVSLLQSKSSHQLFISTLLEHMVVVDILWLFSLKVHCVIIYNVLIAKFSIKKVFNKKSFQKKTTTKNEPFGLGVDALPALRAGSAFCWWSCRACQRSDIYIYIYSYNFPRNTMKHQSAAITSRNESLTQHNSTLDMHLRNNFI